MPKEPKLEYNQLALGDEFPVFSYQLAASMVAAYLEAVEETSNLYRDAELVPPMAIAAYAMAALAEGIWLPPGTIHVSQELEFTATVSVRDTITSYARVSRKQSRGKFHLLAIDLNVLNQRQQAVLAGKTSFILPDTDDGQERK